MADEVLEFYNVAKDGKEICLARDVFTGEVRFKIKCKAKDLQRKKDE